MSKGQFRHPIVKPRAWSMKVHRSANITTPTTGAWTSVDGFSVVTDESRGREVFLRDDNSTLEVRETGQYLIGGVINFQNNTGSSITPLIASRVLVNGATEVKDTQRVFDGEKLDASEDNFSFTGSAFLEKGDYFNLQYYVSTTDVDFSTNSIFDDPIPISLWSIYQGK